MTDSPSSLRPARVLRSALVLTTTVLLATLAAACGGSGSSTPTPTVPAPVLSPVPPNTEIDLDKAAQLYHDGDYDGALTIYSAAALNGGTEQKQAGLWAVAKIQFQQDERSDAEKTARAFRATNPPADLDRQALLMIGQLQLSQHELGDARESLVAYVATGGPALAYAQLYLAQIDQADGKPDNAIPRLNAALGADLPPHMTYTTLMTLAQSDEQKKDHAAGAADYRRAADAAQIATDAAEALWYLADAAMAAGDTKTASDALAELIRDYATTQRAADSANDTRLQPGAISDLDRGLLAFHQQQNPEATAILQPVADAGGPDAPKAQYYLGILSERIEDWNSAIDHYDAAIQLLADGSDNVLRAQAYWDIGTVFERIGQTFDAIDN
ncbi:MAG: tetratricopeptide repeat protein, partial [Chloroflexota bacterium]